MPPASSATDITRATYANLMNVIAHLFGTMDKQAKRIDTELIAIRTDMNISVANVSAIEKKLTPA